MPSLTSIFLLIVNCVIQTSAFVNLSSLTRPMKTFQFRSSSLLIQETNNDPLYNGQKRIVFIRHGCTHMNEYLSQPGTRWGEPTFVDDWKFRDTTLSSRGMQQAKQLYQNFLSSPELKYILNDVGLIVVSPLTRALQTFEIGLQPHFEARQRTYDIPRPPVIALPYAAERVYLASDIGSPVEEIRQKFPFVDFHAGFHPIVHPPNEWWWTATEEIEEWRPFGEGQQYVTAGEPERHFHARMAQLYDWLSSRPEQTIVLLCHWGVLQYLCGHDFYNCEVKVMGFDELRRGGFALTAEEEEAIFIKGERSMLMDEATNGQVQ